MSIIKEIAYSLDDICIVPASTSYINSRSQCNPFYKSFIYHSKSEVYTHTTLPVFTAPMPSVVNESNISTFIDNNITPVIPRSIPFDIRIKYATTEKYFVAFSLNEVMWFVDNKNIIANPSTPYKICIDIANGNMTKLFDCIDLLKHVYGQDIIIMSGNVANKNSYRALNDCGCDYVRVSIGTGSACTTATNLGIYMPMATLIDECNSCKGTAKIIADGGISSYRNIIKALALGADFVMLGGMLNKLKDSAGEYVLQQDGKKYKVHFGMASTKGQISLGKEKSLVPAEGKVVYNEMSENTIADFSKELSQYIRSAMSYCAKSTINDFIGNVSVRVMSENATKQYNQLG